MLTQAQKQQRRETLKPHPIRDHIVQTMGAHSEPVSPTDIAQSLGMLVGTVAYHFRTLAAAGVIVKVSESSRSYRYELAEHERGGPLINPDHSMLALCGALVLPSGDGELPAPVFLDGPARSKLKELREELRPKVMAVARAAVARTTG